MKKNVGGIDRILRIVIGLGLIGAAVTEWVGIWGYLGVPLLLSGLLSRCTLYPLLGINTCKLRP